MKKIKKLLLKLIDEFLKALNWLKTHLKSICFVFISFGYALVIFSGIHGCRSPTSASASINTVGDSTYIYVLPPVTLSNNYTQQAFIPNVMLCIEPTRYSNDNDNFVYLYTLTGNGSRVQFSYGKRQLVYNSETLSYVLNDFKIVTIYGFNTSSSSTGNLLNWSSNAGTISVSFDTLESMLINEDFSFTSGAYTVTDETVLFVMSGDFGGITISLPYTSYSGSITNYSGTFNPTRVISASLGYQDGYDYGYQNGYQNGNRDGYEEGIKVKLSDVTPFEVIKDGVNRFLQIEIVQGVRVGLLIYLGLGILLFNFVVKMFLGG